MWPAVLLAGQDSLAFIRSMRPYVIQEQKITWLLEAHHQKMARERGIQGYRIQIHMDSGNQARLRTQRMRAEFEQAYPGVGVYVVYEEPHFKLRVGDFRSRLDARRFLERIVSDYPAAYIVGTTIAFPELGTNPEKQGN